MFLHHEKNVSDLLFWIGLHDMYVAIPSALQPEVEENTVNKYFNMKDYSVLCNYDHLLSNDIPTVMLA